MPEPGAGAPYPYPIADGKVLIEIRLSDPGQIFTDYSPVPFNPDELTASTEEYLTTTVRDFPAGTQFRIIFRMPRDVAQIPESRKIPEQVRTHYRYCSLMLDRQYRQWIRFGKRYAVFALIALAVCTFVSRAVVMRYGELLPVMMIADGFTIFGWAAVWAPATVLLHELWPIRDLRRTYETIIASEIIVLPEPPKE
jgi:hypothetical protein